jgi:hypothetical protein
VLGISVLGLAIGHLNIIFVSLFVTRLPGNYWFLMVGSIIEGLFGGESLANILECSNVAVGVTTVSAAIESYVVDCTDSSSRCD